MTLDAMTLPAEAPVTIPGAIQFDLASRETGRTYRIFVYEPPVPPPEAGWPTVVLTDGNLSFPIASAVGGLLAFAGEPALIVGVGYPTRSPRELMRLRFRDLTPPTPLGRVAGRPGLPPLDADDFGGAAAFRAFLLSELRPAIAAAFPVDAARTALYGHSLGGLFVLQALFAEPAAWRTYIASSPSVWWNERALLADEPAFAERLIETGARPRLLITIGADEQTPPARPPPPLTAEQAAAMLAEARMVDNARELAERLAALPAAQVRFCALQDDDHQTALATSIGRALAFALR